MGNVDMKKILVTGGDGLLGRTLQELNWERAIFSNRAHMDIVESAKVFSVLSTKEYDTVLHAAAFTSPPLAEKEPMRALESNIIGTANLVRACSQYNVRLVYISTDYVFRGDKGNYKEDDEIYPVNKYAWSKLGGECAVRLYDDSLIIRTSFGSDIFPYPKAFTDQWTSREPVSVTAKKIRYLTDSTLTGTIHIGSTRQSVYEYAVSLGATNVQTISTADINVKVPTDTSLNVTLYNSME